MESGWQDERESVVEKQFVEAGRVRKSTGSYRQYEYFEEDTKGSTKVGKRADLVILDKSPLVVDTMDIKNIKVMAIIKDGEVIYSR